jgi:hypothetical protein
MESYPLKRAHAFKIAYANTLSLKSVNFRCVCVMFQFTILNRFLMWPLQSIGFSCIKKKL